MKENNTDTGKSNSMNDYYRDIRMGLILEEITLCNVLIAVTWENGLCGDIQL